MISLGVEGSANRFSVGIVNEKEVLAKVDAPYKPEKGSGIIPSEAADHHSRVAEETVKKALEEAGVSKEDVDIISYSRGPGLPPCLATTAEFVEKLAEKWNKPVKPVNHPIAHVEIGRFATGADDPIVLYVSGGNTQVIAFEGGKYRVLGETLDQPLGNFLDSFALEAGLEFPGGPRIEALAKEGDEYIELPYTVKGMDVSFSGLFTNLKKKLGEYKLEDLAYSLQETAFAMMIEVTERAMAHCEKDEMLIVGGVAANDRLKEMGKIMCEERNAKFYSVPFELATDNGAMIAWTGLLVDRQLEPEEVDYDPNWRTDQVEVTWR